MTELLSSAKEARRKKSNLIGRHNESSKSKSKSKSKKSNKIKTTIENDETSTLCTSTEQSLYSISTHEGIFPLPSPSDIEADDDDDANCKRDEVVEPLVGPTELTESNGDGDYSAAYQDNDNDNDNDNEDANDVCLPSPKELSNELYVIIATGASFSGQESVRALTNITKWVQTQDPIFLESFLTIGGVGDILVFLQKHLDLDLANRNQNQNRKHGNDSKSNANDFDFLMECIHKTAHVICNVCFVGEDYINEHLAVMAAKEIVNYNGMQTLLLASDAYCKQRQLSGKSNGNGNGKDETPSLQALKAVEGVWNAIMNIYCSAEAVIPIDTSISVLEAGINIMDKLGSMDDHPIVLEILANVFNVFYRIVTTANRHDHDCDDGCLTTTAMIDFFQRDDIISRCLNVFERDIMLFSPSSEYYDYDDLDVAYEEFLEEAILFFYGCHEKKLFTSNTHTNITNKTNSTNSSSSSSSSSSSRRNSSNPNNNYERVLPLCVMGLQEFSQNDSIQEWAVKLLNGASSNINNIKN